MNLKKILGVVLALATLLSGMTVLTACGQSEEIEVVTRKDTEIESEVETLDQRYVCDLPDDLDYDEEEINVMYVKRTGRDDELISAGIGGGVISDAVYERNTAVETTLNVKLAFHDKSTDVEAGGAISTAVRSGDKTLDIFVLGTYCGLQPSISGCYLNLNQMEYIDLSKHYWAQDYNRTMTFTQDNKQFLATSPAAISIFRLAYLTIFNRDLFEERHLPNLYDVVDNGEWTFDYQYQLLTDTWFDTDGNGKANGDDFYGFVTGNVISVDGYCAAADIHMVVQDEDGYLVYDESQLPRMVEMSEKVSDIYNNQGTYVYSIDDIGQTKIIEKFAEQQCLMATTQFLSIETHIGQLASFNYGIAPMPKLYQFQENYYTYVQDQVSCFGISAAISNDERQSMLSAVMEALAYYSNEIVRPAYYDSALSLRFMRDPHSRDILNMMFETVSFDFAYLMNIGGIGGDMRILLPTSNPAIMSHAQGWKSVIERTLKKLNNTLDKLP